jgi:large repetitive protein
MTPRPDRFVILYGQFACGPRIAYGKSVFCVGEKMKGGPRLNASSARRFSNCGKLLGLVFAAFVGTFGAPASAALIATTTTFVGPASPVNYGAALTFTATVTGSIAAPTGTVTFFDTTGPAGQTVTTALSVLPVGSARPLTAAGPSTATASINISTIAAGTHTITATYSGDNIYAASSTAPPPAAQFVLVVNALNTTTTLVAAPGTTNYGQAVLLTATITGGLQASGTVTFKNNGLLLAAVSVTVTTGVATATFGDLPAGTNTLTAVFRGITTI